MKPIILALLLAGSSGEEIPLCNGTMFQSGDTLICVEGLEEGKPVRRESLPPQCGETRGTPWCNV